MASSLDTLLQRFDPITLEEMSAIRLMNRIDTKFVTTQAKLRALLDMASSHYYVQQMGQHRLFAYDPTYFDTPGFDMFYTHQRGHVGRQKLRFRTYVESDLQFMEVKTKNNHGRTKKKRMEVTDMLLGDETKRDFLAKHLRYEQSTLHPTLRSRFRRITLVNKAKTERLTIDVDLCFDNLVTGQHRMLDDLVVVELKRDGLTQSPVLDMLRSLRIHPHGFSKNCMGSAMTNQALQLNRFKPKIIEIGKIVEQPLRAFA